MPLRNSLNVISDWSDLSHPSETVVIKRLGQRSSAKKSRRNRHDEKQFIRNSLTHRLQAHKSVLMIEGDGLNSGFQAMAFQ